ncbi:MAG: DUF4954 family protein [Candidatus Amulumruptor caecigallinarius]|nr:DUF4954 family protein [Candidatus Amulumruptor caecigallinarius]
MKTPQNSTPDSTSDSTSADIAAGINAAGRSHRPLQWWEIEQLKTRGCHADDWNLVRITDDTELEAINNVRFCGAVSIGALSQQSGNLIENALIADCTIRDNCRIRNIGVELRGCRIGSHVRIENTARVEFEPESMCGVNTEVEVLDETGSRAVRIYPGLSAQTAMLMARERRWMLNKFSDILDRSLEHYIPEHVIGDFTVIENCGNIVNVATGTEVMISGAVNLRNGMIINNAAPSRALARIGVGVNAENFILEDGVLDSGATIRNCYIGQGSIIEKGFSAHDSLFFANCSLENGESCAHFAGPYTVSMHKSSLLIGCLTSFMNAGSGTNQSNHLYKLGPVHWGILERGVKTSSDSYLMLGAKIGAFSLLMGQHKTHPDSSQFPFSYLFGDDRGSTVVVPGAMLRSCGLMRDEKKWPARDRRLKRKLPLRDRIVFDVLNPLTVDKMLSASSVIEKLLQRPADDDRYLRYKGMKFTRAALERARHLYELAIFKYLDTKLEGRDFILPAADAPAAEKWVDICGLPMTRSNLEKSLQANSIEALEESFTKAFEEYGVLEWEWINSRFGAEWKRSKEEISYKAAEFDRMVDEDRTRYLDDLRAENDLLNL